MGELIEYTDLPKFGTLCLERIYYQKYQQPYINSDEEKPIRKLYAFGTTE